LRDSAEVFQRGGKCSSRDRNKEEINIDAANQINGHIEKVIIPEIIKVLGVSEYR
jgi:hypothetical protein